MNGSPFGWLGRKNLQGMGLCLCRSVRWAVGVGVAAARGLESTGQAAGGVQRRVAVKNMPSDLDWFAPSCIEKDEDIAGKGATMKFTSSMARFAEERGAKVIVG